MDVDQVKMTLMGQFHRNIIKVVIAMRHEIEGLKRWRPSDDKNTGSMSLLGIYFYEADPK